MVDQAGAIAMFVPADNVFPGYWNHKPLWVCIHKTAGFHTAQDVAAFFQTVPDKRSAHYVVGQDGAIVQCVSESDGAGANCCPEVGHAAFLPEGINLNLLTISIEHVDPATDNSTPLTSAQKQASFKLVQGICARHGIPMKPGDASGGIIGHNQVNPINRAHCPGNYPWSELWTYLQKGSVSMAGVPANWNDDGTTLTAPNGHKVVKGFREYVLAHEWDPGNQPIEDEHGQNPLEYNNTGLGAGTQQMFNLTVLEYDEARGVQLMYVGKELLYLRALVNQYRATQVATDYQEIVQLKAQLTLQTGKLQQIVKIGMS
jgi:N-acetyl-anhydromuramyl-L-alanine amidase AmpD